MYIEGRMILKVILKNQITKRGVHYFFYEAKSYCFQNRRVIFASQLQLLSLTLRGRLRVFKDQPCIKESIESIASWEKKSADYLHTKLPYLNS